MADKHYFEIHEFRELIDRTPPFTKLAQRDPKYNYAKGQILLAASSMPPANVVEVVSGRWQDVYHGSDGIVTQTCSVCGHKHQTTVQYEMPPRCPYCGAFL